VGASTWASGSQVWNGHIGTLIANASAQARNSQVCSAGSTGTAASSAMPKLPTPAVLYSTRNAISISTLPAKV